MEAGIDCTVEDVKGYKLHLMRIADNLAWFCDIDGKRYGNWAQVPKDSIQTVEQHKEEYTVLRSNFLDTLKALGR